MLWFFERRGETVRLETSYDNNTAEFVLVIEWPGRPSVTERFPDADSFTARVRDLEQSLSAERWTQVGSPMILPTGWKDNPKGH